MAWSLKLIAIRKDLFYEQKKLTGCLKLVAIILAIYAIALAWLFTGRHLSPPSGNYSSMIEGTYFVERENNYQMPKVFFDAVVRVSQSKNGTGQIVGTQGNRLHLKDAADGWYFKKRFFPTGPMIFPGLGHNWNEGRITATQEGLRVEGYMLEKGLLFFVIPFSDSPINWSIKLTRVENAEE